VSLSRRMFCALPMAAMAPAGEVAPAPPAFRGVRYCWEAWDELYNARWLDESPIAAAITVDSLPDPQPEPEE